MIDLGSWTRNHDMVKRGTDFTMQVISEAPTEKVIPAHFYNAANGYSSMWQIRVRDAFRQGVVDQSHIEAKRLYRQAIDLANQSPGSISADLRKQLLVNYANCLDTVGRCVEAVTEFDRVLKADPTMAPALGNKGMVLHRLAHLARGHTHTFLLEAHRLLDAALKQPLNEHAKRAFRRHHDQLERVMNAHSDMKPEEGEQNQPTSRFHGFLCDFCVKHGLFLTPTTFIGDKQSVVRGDPMFISQMVASLEDDEKFDRIITFLNQIKQDYVMARYLLVQSQYRSEVADIIDHNVSLYYPLDYSLHSAYIQMLKTSLRLAVDVLDKIAYFVRDYCGVRSLSDEGVSFRNVFSTKESPLDLRPELAAKRSVFLWALLDLSLDVRKGGYYDFIYERRNALTHRFLVVHDMLLSRQTNREIPRVLLSKFTDECIAAMQTARAAVIYLMLFVESEEGRAMQKSGPVGPIAGVPVDDVFRWRPDRGE